MRRLRVLLADDHPHILALLQTLLAPDYHVVGTADNGRSLLAAAQALRPDFVLTDIDMPLMNGIDAVRELHQLLPDCRVIFHSAHCESEVIAAAFEAGASGYLIKGSSQSLTSSIRNLVRHVWKNPDALKQKETAPLRRTAREEPGRWSHQNV
jgi:DNA-binding NarL/FixJ family response regulator